MPDSNHQPVTKTARLATQTTSPAKLASAIGTFAAASSLLRSADVLQSGAGVSENQQVDDDRMTLFHLDGEKHRKRRAAVAPFFTLRAIKSRYEPIMESTADRIVAGIAAEKTVRLDKLAFQYAVAVAAEVLGLDHSDLPAITRRIEDTINTDPASNRPVKPETDEAVRKFFERDVLPAIDARREHRRDDVISRMLDAGASDNLIHTEVRSYAFAGMVTTRELIVMCTWYMIENPALAHQFRGAGQQEQLGDCRRDTPAGTNRGLHPAIQRRRHRFARLRPCARRNLAHHRRAQGKYRRGCDRAVPAPDRCPPRRRADTGEQLHELR